MKVKYNNYNSLLTTFCKWSDPVPLKMKSNADAKILYLY